MTKKRSSPYKDSALSMEMDSAVKGFMGVNNSLFVVGSVALI